MAIQVWSHDEIADWLIDTAARHVADKAYTFGETHA